jgi:hypothetical protein
MIQQLRVFPAIASAAAMLSPTALDEPPKPLNSYFVFEIKPFNAHESARKMRAHVDTLLQEVTKSDRDVFWCENHVHWMNSYWNMRQINSPAR